MIIALSAKYNFGFVNWTITKPFVADENYVLWKQCDDMVTSWIINTIVLEFARNTIYAKMIRDLWKDLKERFSQINGLCIFKLQKKIISIS